MKTPISSFDLFYISYDEPQKEEFWARLIDQAPWAKRVDGVKGFDSAHKECAFRAETEHFITVDGDNTVYQEFFDLALELEPEYKIAGKLIPLAALTFSWSGRNIINHLTYGNGGVKLWSRSMVLNMRTHENATRAEEKVDFCWDRNYVQLNNVYSDTHPNGSPFQAFRAGFREGVKMTLDRGVPVEKTQLQRELHVKNLNRLLIWATIGADVENGLWSIYGTRCGIWSANCDPGFDATQISDYDWFKNHFQTAHASENPLTAGAAKRIPLNRVLGLNLIDFSPEQSAFFKRVYQAPQRTLNPLAREIEGTL